MALNHTASIDEIVTALVHLYTFEIDDPLIPTTSVLALKQTPGSLDTMHLPCLYLWRVGPSTPDLSQGDGHSTARGTFLRDFEFHLATATITQQNDEYRNTLTRKVLDYLIERWLITPDLKDAMGNYLPYVEDWWYTGDQGIGVLNEFDKKFIGSALTFRVRALWTRS